MSNLELLKSHWEQLNGFSPVCVISCLFKVAAFFNLVTLITGKTIFTYFLGFHHFKVGVSWRSIFFKNSKQSPQQCNNRNHSAVVFEGTERPFLDVKLLSWIKNSFLPIHFCSSCLIVIVENTHQEHHRRPFMWISVRGDTRKPRSEKLSLKCVFKTLGSFIESKSSFISVPF